MQERGDETRHSFLKVVNRGSPIHGKTGWNENSFSPYRAYPALPNRPFFVSRVFVSHLESEQLPAIPSEDSPDISSGQTGFIYVIHAQSESVAAPKRIVRAH